MTHWQMLSEEWAPTMIRALEDMIKHIREGVEAGPARAGTLVEMNNGPLERDMDFIRHMMSRRQQQEQHRPEQHRQQEL